MKWKTETNGPHIQTQTHYKRAKEKDELENVIAAKIEIETMSTENGKTINGFQAQNEINEKNEIVFYIYIYLHLLLYRFVHNKC